MTHCLSVRKVAWMLVRTAPALLLLGLLAGCEEGYPPDLPYGVRTDPLVVFEPSLTPPLLDRPGQFPLMHYASLQEATYPLRLGMDKFEAVNPMTLSAVDRAKFDEVLVKMFGKPAAPTVQGIDSQGTEALGETVEKLKLDTATLTQGSIVYRRHCLHCHGTSGDGRGPTAPWVNPHPRDYRQGLFKFTSTSGDPGVRKPLREDLARTIRQGIEGSSMPAFNLLSENEVQQLVSYVIHLSLRGETEFQAINDWIGPNKNQSLPIEESLAGWLDTLADRWDKSQAKLMDPGPYPFEDADEQARRESVQRGFQAFMNPSGANCIACHLDFGRQGPYRFDKWGTLVHPADLFRGVYRGGRRPIDLFWRIKGGIPASAMAPYREGRNPDEETQINREIWDVVNFLQVLPYKDLRDKYEIKID